MKKLLLIALSLSLIACKVKLKPDRFPPPSDRTIGQDRLELQGCGGQKNQIGAMICLPKQEAYVVTEFAGRVDYFSNGANCSIRKALQATPPITKIEFESIPESTCTVTIIYLPEYAEKSQYPIYSLKGDVIFMNTTQYAPWPVYAVTDQEILKVKFPNAVSGRFLSRQEKDIQSFTGDTLTFKPREIGEDLILARIFYEGGGSVYVAIPANYYSFRARPLNFTQDGRRVIFDEEVSIVTVNGKGDDENSVKLDKGYTGHVRAYTVAGRTKVLYFEKGVLQWSK